MITYKTGNLLHDDAEALVNPVNCVGVMGRGLALEFKRIYPDNFLAYHRACKARKVLLGQMYIFTTWENRLIVNFPTKSHWEEPSYLEDIESGLIALSNDIKVLGIKSIAIPALGCGLGGLEWVDVERLIKEQLKWFDSVDIRLYPPSPSALETQTPNTI